MKIKGFNGMKRAYRCPNCGFEFNQIAMKCKSCGIRLEYG